MAGSGRRAMTTALVLAIGCGGLSGCVSTQDKNARAKLVADRTVQGRKPLWLGGRSRDVRVLGVAVVRGRHGGALVVTLRNDGERALTDVPIAVSVLGPGRRRTELNGGRGLDWFQTHVPAVGAREDTTWVFTTRRALPAGRPYAVAGRARSAGRLPRISATVVPAASGRERARRHAARRPARPAAARVTVVNDSDVPQYGLQIYAVVRASGRVIAAGTTTVRHLGSRGRASARVALFGAAGGHTVRVHALPTIFE